MTFAAPRRWQIRPRLRNRELFLLLAVAAALIVGWASLQSTLAGDRLTLGDPSLLFFYLGLLLVVHLAFVLTGRRTDQILLPASALLAGLSLLLMARLPQETATQRFGTVELGLAPLQLMWMTLAFTLLAVLAIVVRSDGWLRFYKYTWAAVGVGLLLLVFLFGEETGGQRLSLRIGPIAGQPSELLKIILVVFLAGYLAENRPLLAQTDTRLGPLRLPPLPYLLPMVAMWGLALAVIIVQRDLGGALLFFAVFLGILYIATLRASYVVLGMLLFVAGSAVLYTFLAHIRSRVDIWIDPWVDAQGAGFQVVRALFAFGRGGVLGTGLGNGLPEVGGRTAIPALHTDFVFTGLAEELGLLGGLAIMFLYLVIAERGIRIAIGAADEFRSLLAAGLTLVIVIQAAIIIGGNIKVLPLTGVTLPFVSYGGSSLLANGMIVGLLLALSDRGVEPPPPPRPGRRERLMHGVRSVGGRVEEAIS